MVRVETPKITRTRSLRTVSLKVFNSAGESVFDIPARLLVQPASHRSAFTGNLVNLNEFDPIRQSTFPGKGEIEVTLLNQTWRCNFEERSDASATTAKNDSDASEESIRSMIQFNLPPFAHPLIERVFIELERHVVAKVWLVHHPHLKDTQQFQPERFGFGVGKRRTAENESEQNSNTFSHRDKLQRT